MHGRPPIRPARHLAPARPSRAAIVDPNRVERSPHRCAGPRHAPRTYSARAAQFTWRTPPNVRLAARITQVALAAHLRVPVQRVNELVRGKRGVTPATAWLLAQAFDTTPEYWINLQAAHDLARGRPARPVEPLKAAS